MILKNSRFSLMALVIMLLLVAGCGPDKKQKEKQNAKSSPKKIIGLLIAGSDACYNAAADVFQAKAEQSGWSVVKRSSDYKKSLEKLHIDEFIAKKMDAIAIITTDIVTAGECTKKVTEAGIPIFYFMTMPEFQPGFKAAGVVTIDWYQTGYLPAAYISQNFPKAKCALIEGGYDQGMTELMRQGFIDGLKVNPKSQAEVAVSVTGSWMKPNAMVAMEELLKNKDAFDCIFTGNEEMMLGVIEVLKKKQSVGKVPPFRGKWTGRCGI